MVPNEASEAPMGDQTSGNGRSYDKRIAPWIVEKETEFLR